MSPDPYSLATIERPLYTHLLIMAVAGLGVGYMVGGWSYAGSAAVGVFAAILYYMMLGVQVRRQLGQGRRPNMLTMVLSFMGRQAVSLLAPTLCFIFLGQGWWLSLVTLVIARHWVLVVAWPRSTAAVSVSQA